MDKEIKKSFNRLKKETGREEKELVRKDIKRDKACEAIRHKSARHR